MLRRINSDKKRFRFMAQKSSLLSKGNLHRTKVETTYYKKSTYVLPHELRLTIKKPSVKTVIPQSHPINFLLNNDCT